MIATNARIFGIAIIVRIIDARRTGFAGYSIARLWLTSATAVAGKEFKAGVARLQCGCCAKIWIGRVIRDAQIGFNGTVQTNAWTIIVISWVASIGSIIDTGEIVLTGRSINSTTTTTPNDWFTSTATGIVEKEHGPCWTGEGSCPTKGLDASIDDSPCCRYFTFAGDTNTTAIILSSGITLISGIIDTHVSINTRGHIGDTAAKRRPTSAPARVDCEEFEPRRTRFERASRRRAKLVILRNVRDALLFVDWTAGKGRTIFPFTRIVVLALESPIVPAGAIGSFEGPTTAARLLAVRAL